MSRPFNIAKYPTFYKRKGLNLPENLILEDQIFAMQQMLITSNPTQKITTEKIKQNMQNRIKKICNQDLLLLILQNDEKLKSIIQTIYNCDIISINGKRYQAISPTLPLEKQARKELFEFYVEENRNRRKEREKKNQEYNSQLIFSADNTNGIKFKQYPLQSLRKAYNSYANAHFLPAKPYRPCAPESWMNWGKKIVQKYNETGAGLEDYEYLGKITKSGRIRTRRTVKRNNLITKNSAGIKNNDK